MFGQVSPRDSICPLCAASKRQHAWHLSASRNDGWSITITLSLAESRATEIREAALHSSPAIISIPEQSSNSRISCRTQKLPYYCKKKQTTKKKVLTEALRTLVSGKPQVSRTHSLKHLLFIGHYIPLF
jgi:hypothetical protein